MPNLPKSLKVLAILILLFAFSLKTVSAATGIHHDFDSLRSLLFKRMEERLSERRGTVFPTLSPRPNSYPYPTGSASPTISPSPYPTTTPQPSQHPQEDYKKEYIMNAINEYRRSRGLYEVQTDPYTCSFAKTRAQEISVNFSHDGFSQRVANKSLPYPSYLLITENIAMTSDYKRVAGLWINSPGHAENMRKDTPFVCVESYGNYYAYEGWKP